MPGLAGMIFGAIRGRLLKTGQVTVYHVGDGASYQRGLAKSYIVLSAGQYAGTVNVDSPHYTAATLSFTAATKTIADTALLLATVKTGDTIVIRGSGSNDGVYTVATGNVAASVVVNEALVNEVAGAYVSICKRVAPSNNAVLDLVTGLMWRRATTNAEKVGPSSNGLLFWYDATKVYTLHPAGADLQIIVSPATLRIVAGSGESARYHVGDVLDCSGFANAVNNLPGYVVTAVTVNGADLDLALQTHGGTLIAEAAAGSRVVGLVVQSIFSYVAAMNMAALGGYSDWRVPDRDEYISICDAEAPSGLPDATAFPAWTSAYHHSSTVNPAGTTSNLAQGTGSSDTASGAMTTSRLTGFIRGG